MNQAPAHEKIYWQAVKSRRPIPEALYSGPRLHPWLAIFYEAFTDLISDRYFEDGLIPWAARQHWAEVHGLDAEATRMLHKHVPAMDMAFLEWRAKKRPKTPEAGGADALPQSR